MRFKYLLSLIILWLSLLLCAISFPSLSVASTEDLVYELQVEENLAVYTRPRKSRKFLILKEGEKVEISKKTYRSKKSSRKNKYRRVVVKHNGARRYGYVKQKDISGFQILSLPQFSNQIEARNENIRQYYIGLFVSYGYLEQSAADTLEVTDGPNFQVGTLSGGAVYPGLYLSLPVGDLWRIKAAGAYRRINTKGEACVLVSQNCDFQPIEKSQALLSGSLLLKRYWSANRSFWWGVNVEMAKIISSDLTIQGVLQPAVEVSNLPIKIITNLNLGYEIRLGKSFVLDPEIRGGVFLGSSPSSINIEGLISLSYAF